MASGGYINKSLHLARKYARIFARGHYLFRETNSFGERSSRKTVNFEEQIMSKDKYPSIFSPQMETIVLIILKILYARRAVLKIAGYSRIFPSFSWGIFGRVTYLDQSKLFFCGVYFLTVLVYTKTTLKQLFTSVSVASGGYLEHRTLQCRLFVTI